jgi:hypothetical protein
MCIYKTLHNTDFMVLGWDCWDLFVLFECARDSSNFETIACFFSTGGCIDERMR